MDPQATPIDDVASLDGQPLPAYVNRELTLFVYLNLMHCSAYCALTPVYTKENFMDVFIKEHMIELPPDEMAKAFGKLDDPSGEGASAYQLCAVWARAVFEWPHVGGAASRRRQEAGYSTV